MFDTRSPHTNRKKYKLTPQSFSAWTPLGTCGRGMQLRLSEPNSSLGIPLGPHFPNLTNVSTVVLYDRAFCFYTGGV